VLKDIIINTNIGQNYILRLCERCHISSDLYTIEFSSQEGRLSMSFYKDSYHVQRKRCAFGRNIIITDNTDWTTAEITGGRSRTASGSAKTMNSSAPIP
jgi:hypothetical protein